MNHCTYTEHSTLQSGISNLEGEPSSERARCLQPKFISDMKQNINTEVWETYAV